MIAKEYRWSPRNLLRRLEPSYDALYLIYHCLAAGKLRRRLLQRRLVRRYGLYLADGAKIGEGLKLPHPNGILIGRNAVIGKNVMIYQQVTIGGKNQGDTKSDRVPRIGDGAILYAGAKLLGDIDVAPGTIVGANAVLTHSTEPDSVWAGIPAQRKK